MTMAVYNTRVKQAATNANDGLFFHPVRVLRANPLRRRLAISVRRDDYAIGVIIDHPTFSVSYGKSPTRSRFIYDVFFSYWAYSGIVCGNGNANHAYIFDTDQDADSNIFYAEPPGAPSPTDDVWVGVWAETLDGTYTEYVDIAVLTDAK